MTETSTGKRVRARLPFYCLATDQHGNKIHLDRPLLDSEGDLCADHARLTAEATTNTRSAWEKFLGKQTRPSQRFELPTPKPHWPFWPR